MYSSRAWIHKEEKSKVWPLDFSKFSFSTLGLAYGSFENINKDKAKNLDLNMKRIER